MANTDMIEKLWSKNDGTYTFLAEIADYVKSSECCARKDGSSDS